MISYRLLGIGVAVAATYFFAARLGFHFAFVAEQVTTVWAPTGIALATLLLWGRVLWPAIWLGAFLANAFTAMPLWAAAGIATGNTLEAVTAASILRRLPSFDARLRTARGVVAFVVVGAIVSTTISATIGVVTLCAAAVQPWAQFGTLWSEWWLGDALGALVVGPVILTLARPAGRWLRGEVIQTGLLLTGAIATTQVVFGRVFGSNIGHPLEFVIFPFVIASAVRLQPAATTLVVLGASSIAIWNTIRGAGPFAGSELHWSLILLQTFTGVLATTGLLLAAAIAERRAGEAAMVEGQRRTKAILETAIDAIIGMDHQGKITEFNPAAERLFGYSSGDVVGRELADFLIPPRDRDRHRDGLRRHLATGEGPFLDRRVETTGHHADGHEFPVEVAITRVPGELPPRFTGFVRDLTARAQAEREREDWLQRESSARREAEAANRAKDEFLATLSHELRTPLNAIVGWTRMLLDGTIDERNAKNALQIIDRNAQLQTRLVADILDVSQIITGGLRLNLRPVELGAVIGAALDAVRPAANAKSLQLTLRLAASTKVHNGDPERLQQVVWNLLANAVKFTPAGGSIDVALLDGDDGGVRICVKDDGVGIEAAVLPHVFERFWQADGSMSRRHGGLGLGLAIVRHLVELHGGTVLAESGGTAMGSTFTVALPQADPDGDVLLGAHRPQIGEPSPTGQPVSLRGCRILVVDDEEDARELAATLLKAAGAIVQTASSVHEALQQLERSQTDVMLADLGMPEVDGYALIRELRRREEQTGRHLPAAAITAYATTEDQLRATAAGFDRHLAKPIGQAALLEAVSSIWRGGDPTPHAEDY